MTRLVIKRILVPLAAQRPPMGLLDHAADMAARLHSELCGLFIEDSDLLNFAQLPIGREISFSTGRIQPSNMAEMERQLHQSATRSQQELSRLATHYKIQSQFVTRRGHTQQTLQMEVQPGDLLILSGEGQHATRQLRQQAHDFLHSGHYALAWLPPTVAGFDGITVVQFNEQPAEECQKLARLLNEGGSHAIHSESFNDVAELGQKLKTCKIGLWLLPYQKDWQLEDLRQMLEHSRCPVLVVNS